MRAGAAWTVLIAIALVGPVQGADPPDPARLQFRIDEGRNINTFVRAGAISAHLILRSGTAPRVLVAFPAGDSGVGLWFTPTDRPVTWELVGELRPITTRDAKARASYGVVADVSVDVSRLTVERAVLSSVRVLRDYEALGKAPIEVSVAPSAESHTVTWSRERLDGAPGYFLELQTLNGATFSNGVFSAPEGKHLRLRITAATGEKPLTPLERTSILTPAAAPDPLAQNVLTFLTYREKFLAGSWRFDTYFGRDTLMSLALLMPVMQPAAVENGLASVLARLSTEGEVAHEEDIGEFAILRNIEAGLGRSDTPVYDYGMVDDDFMLAAVAAEWFLDSPASRNGARTFLAKRGETGDTAGKTLVRNLVWVVTRTASFAKNPVPENLVSLKPGRSAGQWRDSDTGLGGGRYPYDVNAVFVPAALHAIDRLMQSALLDPFLSDIDRQTLGEAGAQFDRWSHAAPPLFQVVVPSVRARKEVARYSAALGVTSTPALDSLGDAALTFNAVALDADGQPVPIMHSDEGFLFLFGTPEPARLERAIHSLLRPFPAGLWTPVGILVANPALASEQIQLQFSRNAYHGTVVWSWQQAVLAAGLERQLMRADLSPSLRSRIDEARLRVWSAIQGSRQLRASELWSWSFARDCYRVEPFGSRGSHADESNAAQLWSTVALALTPPTPMRLPVDRHRLPSVCAGEHTRGQPR